MRRIEAIEHEEQTAKAAAEAIKERERLEPLYMAKSEAERFELAVARQEGASEEEAQARAERAGRLAFETANQDAALESAAEAAFEARLAERRAAVAAAAS